MARNKITQTELVVRILAAKMGTWVNSYELVKCETPFGFTGLQADRRAFELAEEGHWDSPNNRYFIESRGPRQNGNPTKYTQFRVSRKERRTHVHVKGIGNFRDYTFATV